MVKDICVSMTDTVIPYKAARRQSRKSFHGHYRHVARVRAATGVTQQVIKCRYYYLLFVESISCLSTIQNCIPYILCFDDYFENRCETGYPYWLSLPGYYLENKHRTLFSFCVYKLTQCTFSKEIIIIVSKIIEKEKRGRKKAFDKLIINQFYNVIK